MISSELNKVIHTIFVSINLALAIIILGLFGLIYYKFHHIQLPKSIGLYFKICLDPFVTSFVILSIVDGIHYYLATNFDTIFYKWLRFLLTLTGIQIRYTYFFIVLNRIVATVFYKNYSKHSNSTRSQIYTIILTFLTSSINGYFDYLRVFEDLNVYFYTLYIAVIIHFITLALCKVLFWVNHFKYKSIAYQSSLAERHQIYENVKVLKILWPFILIFSLIVPLGPIAVVCYKFFVHTSPPPAIAYLSYNSSFMVMAILRVLKPTNWKQHINANERDGTVPPSAPKNSKITPEAIPIEVYFSNLEAQWK